MRKLLAVLTILVMASPVFADDVMKFAYATTSNPFCWDEGMT